MATDHLREKLNTLTQLIQNEELQIFQHEMLVEAAATSTGDKQVDQVLQGQAQNSKTAIIGAAARTRIYKAKRAALEAELTGQALGS